MRTMPLTVLAVAGFSGPVAAQEGAALVCAKALMDLYPNP